MSEAIEPPKSGAVERAMTVARATAALVPVFGGSIAELSASALPAAQLAVGARRSRDRGLRRRELRSTIERCSRGVRRVGALFGRAVRRLRVFRAVRDSCLRLLEVCLVPVFTRW
jgi:hypothetical protein